MMMTYANAAITLLEKISNCERDSNPRPLRYRCNALHTVSYESHMKAVVCGFGPLCSVDVIIGSSI